MLSSNSVNNRLKLYFDREDHFKLEKFPFNDLEQLLTVDNKLNCCINGI